MQNKLFVGNVSWDATNEDLEKLFAPYGAVESAQILEDKFTGRSRGFGFVVMESDEAAQAAIDALHETDFMGRPLIVNVARPREERN